MSSAPRVLVMAKAPVPGLAKTRLGAEIGMERAAEVAAASLIDTLAVCTAAFGTRYLALTGELSAAARSAEIRSSLDSWVIFEQDGDTFGERLAHAHRWVATHAEGPVVQVGMDTPHLSSTLLQSVVDCFAEGADAVIGPAEDGGWWVLGLVDGNDAKVLVDVVMSKPSTYDDTVQALVRAGRCIEPVAALRDVDTVSDAVAVAALAPTTRFARAWNAGFVTTGEAVAG